MRYFNFAIALQGATRSVIANNHLHNNFTKQQTTLKLKAANLHSPHILKVGGTGLNLSGKILLNGSIIQQLNHSKEQLDLAPLLTQGKNIVEIVGKYSPKSSSIQIEFLGYGTSISQQSCGNGSIEHILILNIY
jgi:hypothetical protein